MITLGDFLAAIDNFYSDVATVQVFDAQTVSDESNGLGEDILGFAFAVSVGEERTDFLAPRYSQAVITNIYICKKRVVKVLVQTANVSNVSGIPSAEDYNEPLYD